MSNEDLLDEWNSYNDVLRECPKSQSTNDLLMRTALENEMRLRGGRFEVIGDEHIFEGYELFYDKEYELTAENLLFESKSINSLDDLEYELFAKNVSIK